MYLRCVCLCVFVIYMSVSLVFKLELLPRTQQQVITVTAVTVAMTMMMMSLRFLLINQAIKQPASQRQFLLAHHPQTELTNIAQSRRSQPYFLPSLTPPFPPISSPPSLGSLCFPSLPIPSHSLST